MAVWMNRGVSVTAATLVDFVHILGSVNAAAFVVCSAIDSDWRHGSGPCVRWLGSPSWRGPTTDSSELVCK